LQFLQLVNLKFKVLSVSPSLINGLGVAWAIAHHVRGSADSLTLRDGLRQLKAQAFEGVIHDMRQALQHRDEM
jgi:hypothetical protein